MSRGARSAFAALVAVCCMLPTPSLAQPPAMLRQADVRVLLDLAKCVRRDLEPDRRSEEPHRGDSPAAVVRRRPCRADGGERRRQSSGVLREWMAARWCSPWRSILPPPAPTRFVTASPSPTSGAIGVPSGCQRRRLMDKRAPCACRSMCHRARCPREDRSPHLPGRRTIRARPRSAMFLRSCACRSWPPVTIRDGGRGRTWPRSPTRRRLSCSSSEP